MDAFPQGRAVGRRRWVFLGSLCPLPSQPWRWHPRAGAVPREVALPPLFGVLGPCPAGLQLVPLHRARVHCVRPESLIKQNVYACLCSDEHLGWLARSLLSAAAPAALGCEPQLLGGLRKGLRDAKFRSPLAFLGWSPLQKPPPLVPAPPAPLQEALAAGGGGCPATSFEGLRGGHALLLWPRAVDTHPVNPLPLSHLSRGLGYISRFQEQLRHLLGSRVSLAVQNTTPDTVHSQHPPGDPPLITTTYNTMG